MAVEQGDADFISKLDEKSKQRARDELNERNDKDTELAVQTFRQWCIEQDWLNTPTDFSFLLRFLRTRKFSQLDARQTFENYWTVRTKFPEWSKDVDPADETIQEILRSGIMFGPRHCDSEGRRLLIDRSGLIDIDEAKKKWGLDNVFKTLVLIQDWNCLDENVQVNGVQVLFDASGLAFNTATTLFTGENGKNIIKYYQRSQPARVKSLHMYKEPAFFDAVYALIKPLMSEKMKGRFKIHGNSMVSVYKDVEKTLLPTEYLPDDYTGPNAGSIKDIIDDMITDMMKPEFRSYIRDLSSDKYGIDLSKRKQDVNPPAESFRKVHNE